MPIYKIKGTDILHSKVNYAEGAEIELTKEEAIPLADYLELIPGTEKETPKPEEIKQEEVKPVEIKQAEPAAKKIVRSKPVKQAEVQQVQPQKEPEPQTVSAVDVPTVQPEVVNTQATQNNAATLPAASEVKPQTQIPPAAQKVIANAITQVNKELHNTPAKTNYQATNMRSA